MFLYRIKYRRTLFPNTARLLFINVLSCIKPLIQSHISHHTQMTQCSGPPYQRHNVLQYKTWRATPSQRPRDTAALEIILTLRYLKRWWWLRSLTWLGPQTITDLSWVQNILLILTPSETCWSYVLRCESYGFYSMLRMTHDYNYVVTCGRVYTICTWTCS